MMPSNDPIVLSYHDVVLRQSDLELLPPPNWLNDQLIAFYYEYLMRDLFPQLHQQVAFMPGASTFLLSMVSTSEEACALFGALQLADKDLVCLAVNNNTDPGRAAGGSHWSLLCYHRPSNTMRHYDSLHSSNAPASRRVADRLMHLVMQPGQQEPRCVRVQVAPQQSNMHDCGVYVLAVTQQLMEWAAEGRLQQLQDLEKQLGGAVSPEHVSQFRHNMQQVIHSLMAPS